MHPSIFLDRMKPGGCVQFKKPIVVVHYFCYTGALIESSTAHFWVYRASGYTVVFFPAHVDCVHGLHMIWLSDMNDLHGDKVIKYQCYFNNVILTY